MKLCVGIALGDTALAQDVVAPYPIDVELVRPPLSLDAMASSEVVSPVPQGTATFTTFMQYESNPLRLYEFDTFAGNVIANRVAFQGGLSYAVTDRMALRTMFPAAIHFGSELPELAGDGFGIGDISVGLQTILPSPERARFGLGADLFLPNGAKSRYMGEGRPRTLLSGAGTFEARRGNLFLVNLAIHQRSLVETREDLLAGPELLWSLGWRLRYDPGIQWIDLELVGRSGLTRGLEGHGQNAVEALFGTHIAAGPRSTLELAVGKGLSAGYGTSGYRLMGGLRFQKQPPPEITPVEEVSLEPLPVEPEPEPAPVPSPAPPLEWQPDQLARIEAQEIVIRDPIQFEFGTTRILDPSLPTLKAVAELMNAHAEIGHLVIVGHASVEGTFEYNYDLSKRRAAAIFEQLVLAGVHPDRMSYRGMGEVVPEREGSDEATLSTNRRVVFQIVRQYRPNETIPALPKDIRLPWSGQTQEVTSPPPPPAPEPAPQPAPSPEEEQ